MKILPVYTACLVFVFLSVRTIGLRRKLKIALGDGGNPLLLRAIRAQANFTEYVPLALLALTMLEWLAAPEYLLHALGGLLLLARTLHAYGLSQVDENHQFRVLGMAGTFAVLLTTALCLLIQICLSGS